MSSGLVRSAIAATLEDKDLVIESQRILNAKSLARELLSKAVESEEKMDKFDSFAKDLIKGLEAACKEDKRLKLHSSKRKNMWSAFHKARIVTFPSLWTLLMTDLGVKNDDTALLTEHVNLKLFESCILRDMPVAAVAVVKPLTTDEANALRYSAGYVPFILKKKLKKRPEFKVWLDSMAVNGEDSSYLEYTKEWTKAIDRGGLFKVNDNAYQFFLDLELKVREHLPNLMKPADNTTSVSVKQDVIHNVTSDDDVLFSWTLVTQDFDDEDLSSELLQFIVELWLTIRGFSAVGAWMEYYKQFNDCETKKEHALRKRLKRKRLETEEESSAVEGNT